MGFLDRCDGLLVLTDADALTGTERGRTDSATGLMLRRVADRLLARRRPPPVGLVFSKFDRIVDQIMPPDRTDDTAEDWGPLSRAGRTWAAVRDARDRGLNLRTFAVSAFPDHLNARQPVGVMAPFAWLMGLADARAPWPRSQPSPVPDGATSFETMRRLREQP